MAKTDGSAPLPKKDVKEAEDLRFDDLDDLLGYRMRRAQGAMHRDFVATLVDLDLTQKQAATLWLINANLGVSQVTLAGALGMDRATMMSVVDRLEERGFVLRKRSTSDRRRQELYLTPAGQNTLRMAKTRIAKHERKFASRLKPSELAALIATLEKISDEI